MSTGRRSIPCRVALVEVISSTTARWPGERPAPRSRVRTPRSILHERSRARLRSTLPARGGAGLGQATEVDVLVRQPRRLDLEAPGSG
jgi:hypothetical protein